MSDAKQFMGALGGDGAPSQYVETPTVTSDPADGDTDGDGLHDKTEQSLGTDPRASNTDGDNLGDFEEREHELDPTVHDYRPPELEVGYSQFFKPSMSWKTTYQLGFGAEDEFGLDTVQVKHNQNVKFERSPDDRDHHWYHVEYSTDAVGTIIDGWKGAATRIHLEDAHGNSRTKVAMERNTIYVDMAEDFGAPLDSSFVARNLGLVSGVTSGAGETASTIGAMLSDPVGYAESMTQIVEIVDQLDQPQRLIGAMADRV